MRANHDYLRDNQGYLVALLIISLIALIMIFVTMLLSARTKYKAVAAAQKPKMLQMSHGPL